MNALDFNFQGTRLSALFEGALHWPDANILTVSDLHLGKSERIQRRSGQMLPPYEVIDTLTRLEDAIRRVAPKTVICLGDSFDDLAAGAALHEDHVTWIARLMAGREWIWIEGNHDPGPLELGGTHLSEFRKGPLVFRHIATDAAGEISGHYHPKARLMLGGRAVTRKCFLVDETRLILPAFGTYTGGLRSDDTTLAALMGPDARAILTGTTPHLIPMPR